MRHVKHIIGLMSGSSLDGIDLALCRFAFDEIPSPRHIDWQIIRAETIPYPPEWHRRLREAPRLSGLELHALDAALGRYFGEAVRTFLQSSEKDCDAVASHGHTVFHFPQRGISVQIGSGHHLAAVCGLPVIYDFRMADIAAGGQGAPLAPVVDEWLLPDYDLCLNIGGIANLSAVVDDRRIGFDIIGANQILDALARRAGHDYDAGGGIAAAGTVLPDLLQQVLADEFLTRPFPKSLGNHHIQEKTLPLFDQYPAAIPDKLATAVEAIARETARQIHVLAPSGPKRLLVTGGGAHNDYLIARLRHFLDDHIELVRPDKMLIDYKESLLMALLGLLRLYHIPNSLPAVTGARHNTIGGTTAY